ncbi:hypothetical protein LSH36_3284g00011, partial [Paralvinella palmiformis]
EVNNKFTDCTLCPDSVSCNDVTGCEACLGSYQPECKQRCEDGFYGTNCQDQCGQCKTNTICDRYNGTCHDGCQIWWTDTKCNTYISLPNRTDEILTLLNKTSNTIEIRWQHIRGISPDIVDFYGYLIQYENGLPNAPYINVGILDYNSDPYWKIENLEINTKYSIKVTPFRKYGNDKESGKSYNILTVKTICSGK